MIQNALMFLFYSSTKNKSILTESTKKPAKKLENIKPQYSCNHSVSA